MCVVYIYTAPTHLCILVWIFVFMVDCIHYHVLVLVCFVCFCVCFFCVFFLIACFVFGATCMQDQEDPKYVDESHFSSPSPLPAQVTNAAVCNSNGSLTCGTCDCNEGR